MLRPISALLGPHPEGVPLSPENSEFGGRGVKEEEEESWVWSWDMALETKFSSH